MRHLKGIHCTKRHGNQEWICQRYDFDSKVALEPTVDKRKFLLERIFRDSQRTYARCIDAKVLTIIPIK